MPVRNRTDEDFIPASLPPYLPDSFRRQEAAAMTEALPPKYRPESVKSVVKRPLTTDSTFEDGSFVPVHTLAQPARIPLSTTGPVAENVLPSRAPPSTLHGVTMHSRNRYVPSLASADEGFNRAAPPPYLPDSFRRQESIDMAEVLPPKYRVESTTSIAKRPLTNESKLGDDSDSPHSPNSENVSVAVNAPAKSEPVQQSFVGQVATLGSASALPASPNSDSVFVPVSVPAKSDSAQVTPFGRDAQRVLPNPITSDNNTATIAQIPSRDVAPSLGQAFIGASLPAYLPNSLRGQENDAGRPPPIYHPKTTQHSANRLVPMESVVEKDDSDSTHSSGLASRETASNVTAMNGEIVHAPTTTAPTSSARLSTEIRSEHVHPTMHSSSSREPSNPASRSRQAAADIVPVSSESARALTSSEPISSARTGTELRPDNAHSTMLPSSNPKPADSDSSNFSRSSEFHQAAINVVPAGRRSSHMAAGTAPITLVRPSIAIRPDHVHYAMLPSNNPPSAPVSQISSRYVGDVAPSLSQAGKGLRGGSPPSYLPDSLRRQESDASPPKCHTEGSKSPTTRPVTMESLMDDDADSTSAHRQDAANMIPVSASGAHSHAPISLARPGTGIRPEHIHPTMLPSNNQSPPTISQIHSRYAEDVAPSAPPPYLPDAIRQRQSIVGPLPPKYRPPTGGRPSLKPVMTSVNVVDGGTNARESRSDSSSTFASVQAYDARRRKNRSRCCSRSRSLVCCLWLGAFVVIFPIWMASIVVIVRGLDTSTGIYRVLPWNNNAGMGGEISGAETGDLTGQWIPSPGHGLSSRSGRQIGDTNAGESVIQANSAGVVPFVVPLGTNGGLPGLVGIIGNGTEGNSTNGESRPSNGDNSKIINVNANSGNWAYTRGARVHPNGMNTTTKPTVVGSTTDTTNANVVLPTGDVANATKQDGTSSSVGPGLAVNSTSTTAPLIVPDLTQGGESPLSVVVDEATETTPAEVASSPSSSGDVVDASNQSVTSISEDTTMNPNPPGATDGEAEASTSTIAAVIVPNHTTDNTATEVVSSPLSTGDVADSTNQAGTSSSSVDATLSSTDVTDGGAGASTFTTASLIVPDPTRSGDSDSSPPTEDGGSSGLATATAASTETPAKTPTSSSETRVSTVPTGSPTVAATVPSGILDGVPEVTIPFHHGGPHGHHKGHGHGGGDDDSDGDDDDDDDSAEDAKEEADEAFEEMKEKVEEADENVKEGADDAKETAHEAIEEAKEAAHEAVKEMEKGAKDSHDEEHDDDGEDGDDDHT